MGKIKSKIIKKAARNLLEKDISFKEDFQTNKKILGNNFSSKKIRNQLAGYITRLKKQEQKKFSHLETNKKK